MIKDFVFAWEANKGKLRKYFEEYLKEDYCGYSELVRLLFKLVVNPYMEALYDEWPKPGYDVDRMHVIDDGEFCGTLMYLIPKYGYEPDCDDYVMTYAWYGSCDVCDLIQNIYWRGGKASENDVKALMQLSLHLLQRCKFPYREYEPECNDKEEWELLDEEPPKRLTVEELEALMQDTGDKFSGKIGSYIYKRI